MPLYTYKGYDATNGKSCKGKIEAESPKAARTKLRQRNRVIVSDLKEEASLETVKAKQGIFSSRKVPLQEIAIMTRQFATLTQAHVPLDESLRALTAQVEHIMLRNTMAAIKDQVSEGKSLADALSTFPGVFSKLYINMVRAGESSGALGLVLERLADFLEYQDAVKGKIVSAVSYPAIMITASVSVIAYLMVSVVPKLTKVFANLKVTLPWYTKFVIGVSDFIQQRWYVILVVIGTAFFSFRAYVSSEAGRKKFDIFVLGLPIFGPVLLRINISRFTKTLSTMLTSGVPIVTALEITRNIIGNTAIAEVLETAKIAVQEGRSLGASIEKSEHFPPLVTHMIMTGERTGQLEEMLTHVSKAYDAEVERKISAMIAMIEPLMIIMMAGVTVLVVIAMIVPMLRVMNNIR